MKCKMLFFTFSLLLFSFQGISQEEKEQTNEKEKLEERELKGELEERELKEGDCDDCDECEHGKKDTNIFMLGDYKVYAVKECDTTDVDTSDPIDRVARWGGVDIGVNGFLTPNQSFTPSGSDGFMELDYARSVSWSLNLFEQRLPLAKEYLGLVTGFGIEFKNYALRRNVELISNQNTVYGEDFSQAKYDKNKLKATYIQVPLLLQLNTHKKHNKAFHLAVGGYGGYRIGSRLKQKYEVDGEKFKSIHKGDFNLNPFKYGLTARIGYGKLTLFAKYGLSPLFLRGNGPELYPFTAGVQVIGF